MYIKKHSLSKEEAQVRREKSLDIACKITLPRWYTRDLADLHLLIETERIVDPKGEAERVGNAALEVIDKRVIAILLDRRTLWNNGQLKGETMPEFGERINLALAQMFEAISELELDFVTKKTARSQFWHDFFQLALDSRELLERDKAKRNLLTAEATHFYCPADEEGGDDL